MRANEVLRTVFKKKPKPMDIKLTITVPPVKQVKRRPGRQKKTSSEMPHIEVKIADSEPTQAVENSEPIQDVAKKKAINTKTSNRKRCATVDIPVINTEPQAVQTNEPTEETPKKRRKLSLKRKPAPFPVKETEIQKVTPKGKEETQESSHADKTVVNSNKTDVDNKNETQSQDENIISCRKNSSSSTSTCLSWTKDISSSSTITCMTVQSNDFVRIDKKLPIIKLTDIDDKLKIKVITDDIYENSIDTHENEQRSPSRTECSEFSAADFNVSQTLNLSTSSMTSVRSNEPQNNATKNKEIVENLQRSLDNLASKMKNFDLEIINWIGYENESKDVSTKYYNDRTFEILKEESDVIKYCKEIKRVLGVEEDEPEIIETEIKNINEVIDQRPDSNKSANDVLEHVNQDPILEKPDNLEKIENGNDAKYANNSPNRMECEKRKSFDKEVEFDNTEDDDAISLFADTMADTDYDDFDPTPPRRRDKFSANERVCQSSQYQQPTRVTDPLDKYEKTYSRTVCEKHTADSSSNYNRTIDSSVGNKFDSFDDDSISDSNHFSNRLKFTNSVDRRTSNELINFGGNFGDYDNDTNTNVPVNFNRKFTDFQNIQIRAPVNSFSQRFSQIQNDTDGAFSNLPDTLNSQDMDRPSAYIPENSNEKPNDINSRSMVGPESSGTVEFKHPGFLPIPSGSKHVHSGSNIFKNICIFNLASICKNAVCNFPHVNISVDLAKPILQNLSEEQFIRECSFMLCWTVLRRKFGCCFVEECVRRNLTPWVLHITVTVIKDCRKKFNDKSVEDSRLIELVEIALLHLNNADLEACEKMLRSKICPDVLLCDYFMKIISETQNFSRFKNVFIKLTVFMCHIGRSFGLNVASQVLERLCILPYDDALARVLIQILERTSPKVFSVAMMGLFEMQLSTNNVQLYERLVALKGKFETNLAVQSPHSSPRISPNVPLQTSTPAVRADSPDTTNVDSMNKTTEPVITRTITFNRTINTGNLNVSSGSSDGAKVEPRQCKLEQRWRYSPSVLKKRRVYNHWGTPRMYGNTPNFRRPPP
ncbi:uncharacterized protein [Epargyreus clarus]